MTQTIWFWISWSPNRKSSHCDTSLYPTPLSFNYVITSTKPEIGGSPCWKRIKLNCIQIDAILIFIEYLRCADFILGHWRRILSCKLLIRKGKCKWAWGTNITLRHQLKEQITLVLLFNISQSHWHLQEGR